MVQDHQLCPALPSDVGWGKDQLSFQRQCITQGWPGGGGGGGRGGRCIPVYGVWLRVQGTNQASRLYFNCVVGMQEVRGPLADTSRAELMRERGRVRRGRVREGGRGRDEGRREDI